MNDRVIADGPFPGNNKFYNEMFDYKRNALSGFLCCIFGLGSYHKRQILNPRTPLPPMVKSAKFQIRQRSYQPNQR